MFTVALDNAKEARCRMKERDSEAYARRMAQVLKVSSYFSIFKEPLIIIIMWMNKFLVNMSCGWLCRVWNKNDNMR